MASDADFEAMGLLEGLQGDARQERVDLICWLLDRGFDIGHIRGSVAAPLTLPASRVIGDDGTYVSARQICEANRLDVVFLQRIHCALGLPRIEDPDAKTLLRVDGEAAGRSSPASRHEDVCLSRRRRGRPSVTRMAWRGR